MNNDFLPLDMQHPSADSADAAAQLIARLMDGTRRPQAPAAQRTRILEQAAASVTTQSCALPGAVLVLLR